MIETNELLIALVVLNVLMLKMYPKNYVMQILFGLGIPILIGALLMGLFFNSMKRSN
jgi:uncharacterized SAM-binding protein YcdF (DUF218 family)